MNSDSVLTLNAGSSSIKFSLFNDAGRADPEEVLHGQVEGIGAVPHLLAKSRTNEVLAEKQFGEGEIPDHHAALTQILSQLEARMPHLAVAAVGHRVVHGGARFTAPVVIDDETFAAMKTLSPLAPLHQPHNLAGIEAARKAFPEALQVACFDTAFHRAHPWVADTFGLPKELYDEGVRRYGFHGLSYEYVSKALVALAPEAAKRRVIVAHLGNGASMCAIENGRSVGSTMGFTALDGLPMGTRCGQLDPGVVLYLMAEKKMTPQAISDLLYKQSGLKGLSGLSQDMRELEQAGTPNALGAIEYFVSRIRRELGALTAVMNGVDFLAFSGGIGENAWRIRERVCRGFEYLGIELDHARNQAGETLVSAASSRVKVFIVRTNEELVIARHTLDLRGK